MRHSSKHRVVTVLEIAICGMNSSQRSENEVSRLEAQVEDLAFGSQRLARAAATQKRLTWRGLFGGGKAE